MSRWPALKQAQRARKARLSAFFREYNVRYPHIIEQRLQGTRRRLAFDHRSERDRAQ